MGAVLEMISLLRSAVALSLAVLVAGCASDPSGNSSLQLGRQLGASLFDRGQQGENPAATLTRAQIANQTLPLLRVRLPETDTVAVLALAAVNDGKETWVASNPVSVILDGPVLFGTRGLGPDLMTAETRSLRGMLAAGRSGTYSRTLRRYDGSGALVAYPYNCSLSQDGGQTVIVLERSHTTRRATERCSGSDGESFQNVYWTGSDGFLWKSVQWISPQMGYMETERLVR